MSLILDALNRSRQDSEQLPGLSSVHPVEAPPQGSQWLQWLLVSALGLAVLAIGWLLIERAPAPAAVPAEISVKAVEPAPPPDVEKPAPVKKIAIAPEAKPAVVTAPAVPAPSTAEPAVAVNSRPRTTPAPVEPDRPEVDAGVAALYQQAPQPARAQPAPSVKQTRTEPTQNTSRVEETVDIEKLVEQAQAELKDATLSEHPVPLLSSLSQQTKDGIPTLLYQRHDYSGDPGRSSVVINGKTLRAGASAGGIKVEEILPDSVVLEVKGTRFRLRALNSWVNL